MRQLNDEEMKALLKGAQDGILDLRTLPGYRDGLPEFFYGECTKHDDGSFSWEAKHLPIVSKLMWEGLCKRFKREPIVILSKADRAEIVKASIFGRIDERLLPHIYPLVPMPRMADVVFLNFSEEDVREHKEPEMPKDWASRFWGMMEPSNDRDLCLVCISHYDCEKLNGRYDFEKEAEPFDYSTGKPLEDATMANFFDNISLGIGMLAH